ncbi:DEKNAAC100045 [Brettanomyces naardenensis]|uniref:Trafficking protein particle complex subunit n=1 Tax=Brettanomyces naardenensis TaxID=13370 RepID=A0A448YEJ3_BRENA|nr:DEKNAAC100045 [Brettanomyces naardenensis]
MSTGSGQPNNQQNGMLPAGSGTVGGTINCRNDDNVSKLLFGILFSIRKISNYLVDDNNDNNAYSTFKSNTVNGYNKVTNFYTLNYKCHVFETITGLKFVVVTDMRCRDLNVELTNLFNTVYLPEVVQNQASPVDFKAGECIDNEPFIDGVDAFWRQLVEFN